MTKNDSKSFTQRVEEAFFGALDCNDPEQRELILNKLHSEDPGLCKEVRSMLADFPKAEVLFNDSSRNLVLPIELLADEELSEGALCNNYRIIQLLGEGGSSKVYKAEQIKPLRREVALKIVKLGMDTQSIIERFQSERQTLAMLEHPNISQVFDAGMTPTGRPYFVMELVQGHKITDYCEANAVPLEERLEIVCEVCSALQFAHNKGVIHRDIKPSNILVSRIDGKAMPKLIDFGIAKATDSMGSDGKTILGQPLGTPAYMSPEQLCCANRDIDTRSDEYGMGVVLYELITGSPLFCNDELLEMGFEGMRHKILYDVPAPPSSILQSPSGKSIAGKELDWIVMKAIEKDRERRYPTVHALADDLRRYLRNEPVEAHPPSRIYRLTKLIQRYRITALSIAAAFMALTGGLTFSSILYFRARRAELEQFKLRELAEESAHVSKAAILIMQGRMPEAEEEVRKMGGILSQPSLEATQVFSSLAMWNAKQGNWGTAADRWLAMSRVNQFDDSDMTDKVTENLLPIAPILLKTGDTIRYREFQQFLIDRIGMTNHPFATEHLLKLCLLTPADSSILNSLKHAAWVAEASLPADMATPPTDWMEAWRCVALAMWYFRNGQPDVAIPWCERSLLRDDWEKARGVQARLIRSMSLIKRGVSEPQYTAIQREKSEVIHYLQLPLDQMQGGYFHDWLIAEILLKEAEQLSHKESLQEDMQKDAH